MQKAPLIPKSQLPIEDTKDAGLYFYLKETTELLPNGRVRVDGDQEMIMLGGYSYLGLLGDPRIAEAAAKAAAEFGTGSHGVRFLSGTITLHNELEERLARLRGTEAAVAFSSGYTANVATISSIMRKGDIILGDKLIHASIVDGCLLSRAELRRFRHNDIDHLEQRLKEIEPGTKVLVIVDGIYSMDGDIADLPPMVELCKKYGAYLMVDEAHSFGVIGDKGMGIAEHFGLPSDAIDIHMGTLSKGIPTGGGFVAGKREIVDYLKHEGRAFIYSGAIPPPSAAAAIESLKILEEEPWRVKKLRENYSFYTELLRKGGLDILKTEAAIVPINCGDAVTALMLAKYCQDRGIFVQAIGPPVVPKGVSRLRTCVSASLTTVDLEYCANTIIEGAHEIGMLTAEHRSAA